MATTVATLIQMSKGRYGLERTTTEDVLFTDAVMIDILNSGHNWFAEVARPYESKALTVSIASGTSQYALDGSVIEPDIYNVVVYNGTTYTRVPFRKKVSLLESGGAFQSIAAAPPTSFYLRSGASAGAMLYLELYPKPNFTQAGGLIYDAWVYPARLAATSDNLPLNDGQIDKLIPAVCWQMALLEQARGRGDAPVETWHALALQQALGFAETMRRLTQEPPRTASVGLTSGEDAQRRRDPLLRAGVGR